MTNTYQALIFDCDGTLADTMPAHYLTWKAALEPHDIHFPEDLFYSLGGMPTHEIITLLGAQAGRSLDVEAIAMEKERFYYSELAHILPIEPVVAIAREHLGKIPMAVASGSLRRVVDQTLKTLNISDWFDAVVTADDVENHKPAPDIFLEAAKRLNVDPTACQAFEDGDLGLEAIRAAGMTAVDIRTLH